MRSVAAKHQRKIALDTLKMSSAGAAIMGGMDHGRAIHVLLAQGMSEREIEQRMQQAGHSGAYVASLLHYPVKNPGVSKADIYAQRDPVRGFILVSTIIDGVRVKRQYYGYTKKEAVAEFYKMVRSRKNPEYVRDSYGRVVSQSRNLAGVHRYAASHPARRVTVAKLEGGGGVLWIDFENGAAFTTRFASYSVMAEHIRDWKALRGVPLYYMDKPMGKVGATSPLR